MAANNRVKEDGKGANGRISKQKENCYLPMPKVWMGEDTQDT